MLSEVVGLGKANPHESLVGQRWFECQSALALYLFQWLIEAIVKDLITDRQARLEILDLEAFSGFRSI